MSLTSDGIHRVRSWRKPVWCRFWTMCRGEVWRIFTFWSRRSCFLLRSSPNPSFSRAVSSSGRWRNQLSYDINSLRPSDTIWRQWCWATLAQVMALCLMATSHYLNQCCFTTTDMYRHSSQGDSTIDTWAICQQIIQLLLPSVVQISRVPMS